MKHLNSVVRSVLELAGQLLASTALGKRLALRYRINFLPAHFHHLQQLAAPEAALAHGETSGAPFISLVAPLYNSQPGQLEDLCASVRQQAGPKCELILSDDGSSAPATLKWLADHAHDPSVRILRSAHNQGIAAATNAGIEAAASEWIGLIDHDDLLAPFAVSRIHKALSAKPGCQFLYTDELIVDERLKPLDYFLKPAWDPVLLSGVNYINHLSVYRRDRLQEIGGLRSGVEGSQDYDLVLRYTRDLAPAQICHLPYPAYLWRRYDDSYSSKYLERATVNARKALGERYGSGEEPAAVEAAPLCDLHRVRFDRAHRDWPLVSVVIPSRNALPLISTVLAGLSALTDYPALEILVIDNGTTDPAVLALYDRYRDGPIPFRAVIEAAPFNFSAAVNKGMALAKGDFILLLNNDIEMLEPGWLKEMVSCFQYDDTGIVGAKLLYPDGTLQHAGVIAGLGGLAGHWYIGQPDGFPGPMGRLWVRQSVSIVTGACFLVSRACLDAVGKFDETTFPIAYNDVDFCLRAVRDGFRVVWTPFAKMIHHESASRGSDETAENIARFQRDQQSLRERHRTDAFEDRAFSPWYTRDRSDPDIVFLEKLPLPR